MGRDVLKMNAAALGGIYEFSGDSGRFVRMLRSTKRRRDLPEESRCSQKAERNCTDDAHGSRGQRNWASCRKVLSLR
jgi:hypothetical protein